MNLEKAIMKQSLLLFTIISLCAVTSCNSTRNVSYKSSEYKKEKKTAYKSSNKQADSVLREAKKYLGTPYKYGGTTKSGMDCSGLVINAYNAAGIQMPRISRDQANEGKEIKLKDVREGDLVFFNTSGSRISHVGIVEDVKNGEVFFIHSSSSKGVIVSSIEETYWSKRFVKAVRVL